MTDKESSEPGHTDDPDGNAARAWNPDGTELARALISRARVRPATAGRGASPAAGRSGRPGRTRRWLVGGQGAGWSGPTPDERDPQPLERNMERLITEHGWVDEISVHALLARWDLLVGREIAAHVRPERYAEGELTVRADSTAWATQLRLLAPKLVRQINKEIGDGTLERVVVLGPQAPSWAKGRLRVRGRGPRDTYG